MASVSQKGKTYFIKGKKENKVLTEFSNERGRREKKGLTKALEKHLTRRKKNGDKGTEQEQTEAETDKLQLQSKPLSVQQIKLY